ncbi:phospholipase [Myriangium duriaei CBS 260.36]|uniref:Phospholipase n=1 Tax=Myriangium duriaei CBS 260.36 TaxID=1168546 RepID=A0A9P4J2V7_9PEZI|nr:phospholipase [Myriangium duriaei CBS 260.36]
MDRDPQDATDSVKKFGLCLLSLDGGGIRGLSSLCILKQIMDQLNDLKEESGQARVKPSQVFDLIGGTNTGGLIAIMLGRLEMDVDECIEAYIRLAESVFGDILDKDSTSYESKPEMPFNSAAFDKAIKIMFESKGIPENAMLNAGDKQGCRIFVCTTDKNVMHTVRLRSYRLSCEPNIEVSVRKAALATFATAPIMKPVEIGFRAVFDGDFTVNNPVEVLEGETASLWQPSKESIAPLVKCLISIGTGHLGVSAVNHEHFYNTLVQLSRHTEHIEKRFADRWAKFKRYFRFNVQHGLEHVDLAEYNKLGEVQSATHNYLTHQERKQRITRCARKLALKQGQCNGGVLIPG